MLQSILAISGKPGLYKLVSRGNRCLIVETLDAAKKRMPAQANEKVISLYDISMYTDEEDIPLPVVLESVKTKYEGKKVEMDLKNASKDDLFAFFGEVVPNFDRDRVHGSDVKKLIQWYNLLIEAGETEFIPAEEAAAETAETAE